MIKYFKAIDNWQVTQVTIVTTVNQINLYTRYKPVKVV